MSDFLWLDEAIIMILKRHNGRVSQEELMKELWELQFKEHRTGCTGWHPYITDDGELSYWCKQAWNLLSILEGKGVVRIEDNLIVLVGDKRV